MECSKCHKNLRKAKRFLIVGSVIALTLILFLILNYTVTVSFGSEGWAVAAILLVALELLLGNMPLLISNEGTDPKVVPQSYIYLSCATLMLVTGLVSAEAYLEALSDKNLIAIACLCILSRSLESTGVLAHLFRYLVGYGSKTWLSQLRLFPLVVLASSFINDTPVVAMLIPSVESWSVRAQQPLQKFLLPISYSSLLGGMITLIGTSTNLVVQSQVAKLYPDVELTFFGVTPVGLPVAIVGVLSIVGLAQRVLSSRTGQRRYIPRSCTVYRIDDDSELIGQKWQETALATLPGVILYDMVRSDNSYSESASTIEETGRPTRVKSGRFKNESSGEADSLRLAESSSPYSGKMPFLS